MALLPPTLAQVGQTLWGSNWAEPLADALNLKKSELVALDACSDEFPPEMNDQAIIACRLRIQDIEMVLRRLEATALCPSD